MSKKVYIGNLPWEASETDIRDMFQEFGEVQSVNIVTNPRTGRSRGFGFIEMENADAAIAQLNDREYGGRKLRVNEARDRQEDNGATGPAQNDNSIIENKIYVGNLPWEASEEQLRKLFEKYGEVHSVNIITNPHTGRSKGFGFVEMENAEAAIAELNEKEFGGRNLRVNQARERNRRY